MSSKYSILAKIDQKKEILSQVAFHLESQAKPKTPKCNPDYYLRIAEEVRQLNDLLVSLLYE